MLITEKKSGGQKKVENSRKSRSQTRKKIENTKFLKKEGKTVRETNSMRERNGNGKGKERKSTSEYDHRHKFMHTPARANLYVRTPTHAQTHLLIS